LVAVTDSLVGEAAAAETAAPDRRLFGWLQLVLLGIGFTALIGMAAASVTLARRNQQAFELANNTQTMLSNIRQALEYLEDAETGQRGFLLTERESYLGPYNRAAQQAPQQIDALVAMAEGSPVADVARDFRSTAQAKLAEVADSLELYRTDGRGAAIQEVMTDKGRALMDRARADAEKLSVAETAQLARRLDEAQHLGRILTMTQLGTAALVLVIALLSGAGLYRNVRELKHAQHALAETNANLEGMVAARTAALEQANEEIQRFAYIVSHDLRAPLVNILGFTTELETAARTVGRYIDRRVKAADSDVPQEVTDAIGEDVPEAFGFIKTSTAKMDRLIGAILKLSREGRRVLTPEPLAMRPLLEGVAANLKHRVDEKGAEIVIQRTPDLVADRLAIEQVFGNLLDNAVKYLAPERPGVIIVRGTARPPFAVFEVEDNGRGIAARDSERVFELFRRSGEQNVPGEGIGLAYVRQLIYRLGGTIELESTLGKGSIFRVKLPLVGMQSRKEAA
jgi:signal transduction histidine kinase